MSINARPRRDIQARYCLGGRHALCPVTAGENRITKSQRTAKATKHKGHEGSRATRHGPLRFVLPGLTAGTGFARFCAFVVQNPIFRIAPHAGHGATVHEGPPPPPSSLVPRSFFKTVRQPAILAVIVLLLMLSPLIWYGWRRPLSSSRVMSAMVTLAPQTPMALALASASTTNQVAADQVTPSPTPSSAPSPTATPSPPIPTVTAAAAVPEATIIVEATTEISFVALGVPSRAELYLPTPTRALQEQDNEELWELLPKRPPRLAATRPPDRIVIDSIGLDAPVVPVSQKIVDVDGQATAVWEVAEYAAGWHKGSALPGQAGNIVLSGHHNIKGEVFRHLEHLRPGDVVVLYADGRPFWYMVQLKMIVKEKGEPLAVREENARWIGPFPDERLTLVACWPYTSNTHRVIVVAQPADVLLPLERPIPPVGHQPLLDFAHQGP